MTSPSDKNEPEQLPAKKPLLNLAKWFDPEYIFSHPLIIMEFFFGFIIWYVIVGGFWFSAWSQNQGTSAAKIELLLNFYIWPAHFGILAILAVFRRWGSVLGILAALGLNMLISLILGLFFNVVCFIPFFAPYR